MMATRSRIRSMQRAGGSRTWCMIGTPRAMFSRSKKSDQAFTPGSLYILYCSDAADGVIGEYQTLMGTLSLRTGRYLEHRPRCKQGGAAGVALKGITSLGSTRVRFVARANAIAISRLIRMLLKPPIQGSKEMNLESRMRDHWASSSELPFWPHRRHQGELCVGHRSPTYVPVCGRQRGRRCFR